MLKYNRLAQTGQADIYNVNKHIMTDMNSFVQVLSFTVPALIVGLIAYLVLRAMLKKDKDSRRADIIVGNQKIITPLRLQAYERVVMFLERIHPESLAVRINEPGMSVQVMHGALLKAIRKEYEHNLSQQIYMSTEVWEVIRNTKESMVQLVNVTVSRLNKQDPAIKLVTMLIDTYSQADDQPIEKSLRFIKKEIANFMDTRNNFY